MKNKKIFWLLAVLVLVFGVLILIKPVHAQINIWQGIEDCRDTGNCDLTSGETFFLNLIGLILKFLGVAALVGFIYGGITWITSGGSPDKVKRGKDALVGSVVGVAIVLFAYVIIYTVINVIAKPEYNPLSSGNGNTNPGCQATAKYQAECPALTLNGGEVWRGGDPSCHGDQVSNLQEKLIRYKCLADAPGADSCFGLGTQTAIQKFFAVASNQTQCPTCKTDGTVDYATHTFVMTSPDASPCP